MNMKFGSVCSGIEAASMAWNTLGWKASWLAEIEQFPSEVLKHHYPDTPNYGDVALLPDMVLSGEIEAPDVLVGGTPCQSFSVAGLREGLSDERGRLTIKYVELANAIDTIRRRDEKDECIIVWENVPGILNSKDNAFGCFIAALAGGSSEARAPGGGRWANAGYVLGPKRAVAWRVLDAQYFGLAQRRKRVFVVASARKDFCPAEVLFEFDGVRRDIAPSREAGKEAADNAGAGANQAGFRKLTFESYAQDETASTMMARDHKSYTDLVAYGIPGNWIGRKTENGGNSTQFMHEISPNQTATDKHGVIAIQGSVIGRKPENGPQGSGYDDTGVCFTQTSVDRHAVAIAGTQNEAFRDATDNLAPTLRSGSGSGVVYQAVATATAVRRLTPVECERLQGFPDFYTMIPWRNKPADDCPDGHRYKALGNSMAVPCMTWLGQRIQVAL